MTVRTECIEIGKYDIALDMARVLDAKVLRIGIHFPVDLLLDRL